MTNLIVTLVNNNFKRNKTTCTRKKTSVKQCWAKKRNTENFYACVFYPLALYFLSVVIEVATQGDLHISDNPLEYSELRVP